MKRAALLVALALSWAQPADACVRSRTSAGTPLQWWTTCIPFHVHEAGTEDEPFSQALAAVKDSFATWVAPSCGGISLEFQGLTNDPRAGYQVGGQNINNVLWRESASQWPHNGDVIAVTTVTFCDRAGGACPFAGAIIDADIELNGSGFTFTTTTLPARVAFDIANTVTHEVGHFLGFDHTPVAAATMFASAPRGELDKRSLHADDIECLCDVYPAGEGSCAAIPVQGDHYVDLENLQNQESSADDGCAAQPGAPARGAALGLWLLALLGIAGARRRQAGVRAGGRSRS